jgi:hypothetical protein
LSRLELAGFMPAAKTTPSGLSLEINNENRDIVC